MKRVWRATLGLMGAGMMVCIGLLTMARSESFTAPFLVVLGIDDRTGQYRLYMTALDSDFARPITRGYDDLYHIDGPTPDGWIYFDTDRYQQNPTTGLYEDMGGVYRVKFTGGHEQRLVDHPSGSVWWSYAVWLSPDGRTLIYSLEDATTGRYQLYQVNTDGGEARAITPPSWDAWVETIITDDAETWVIASVYIFDIGPYLMRVGVENGDVLNLTPDGALTYFDRWVAEEEWLLFVADERLWKIRLNGSEATPIGPDGIRGWTAWLPDTQLVVVAAGTPNNAGGAWTTPVVGVRLVDGTVAWELPSGLWGGLSPNGEWIAYGAYQADTLNYTTIERMRPDGTDHEVLVQLDKSVYLLAWAPDGQSLYYFVPGSTNSLQLWRLDLTSPPRTELVAQQNITYVPDTWSVDWRYIIIGPNWVEVETARQGRILPHDSNAVFVSWASPSEGKWSPVGLLVIGGALVLAGVVRRGGKGR